MYAIRSYYAFLDRRSGPIRSSCRPRVCEADLSTVLPTFVTQGLRRALPHFERKMRGFVTAEATLIGVETRTSAPLRILRDDRITSYNVCYTKLLRIMNAGFMVIASLLAVALLAVGLTVPQLFLVTGLMNAAVAFYIYGLVPEFLLRFACWALRITSYNVCYTKLLRYNQG